MILIDTFFQSIIYIPLIFGIFLSFSLLRLTDLTADGSFVMGAGLYARLTLEGAPYGLCIFAGVLGGFSVGLALAYIQKNNRVPSLVASILCVFMLYSLNLLIMGRPNISLLSFVTPFSQVMEVDPLIANLFLIGGVGGIVCAFLFLVQSKAGLLLRAFGVNAALMKNYHYKPELIRSLGLGLSNALYATSGILCAQTQYFADVNMGFGVALMGIGAVLIGIQFFIVTGFIDPERFKGNREILACIMGLFFYFLLMNILLSFSVDPRYLKLILGMLLIFAFMIKIKGLSHATGH